MSWFLFDERGRRLPKATYFESSEHLQPGWIEDALVRQAYDAKNVFGFVPVESFVPTFFAAKMSKGYRVFRLDDTALHSWVDQPTLTRWWHGASPDQKRLPTIAAVEMWVRHVGVQT